jgi:hypothetical protein
MQVSSPCRPPCSAAWKAGASRLPGGRIAYPYEIREHAPGEQFVMGTAEGPFAMETTYTWKDVADGATGMSLRNRGEPGGVAKVAAPIVARAIRHANRKDLQWLEGISNRHDAVVSSPDPERHVLWWAKSSRV